jgi:hypothetical protein
MEIPSPWTRIPARERTRQIKLHQDVQSEFAVRRYFLRSLFSPSQNQVIEITSKSDCPHCLQNS